MQKIIFFIINHPVLSTLWIILLITILYKTYYNLTSKINTITHTEAVHLINKENAVVVDLRNHKDFIKGSIIDSVNLLPIEIKTNHIGELIKKKESPIIVVDYIGTLSQNSALLLKKMGFKKVFILKGGISKWCKEHLPLVNRNKN